jgi:hypothetical protein
VAWSRAETETTSAELASLGNGDLRGILDMDRDGRDEWLVAEDTSRTTKIRIGFLDADGHSMHAVSGEVEAISPIFAVGDLDGDGRPELVAIGSIPWNDTTAHVFGLAGSALRLTHFSILHSELFAGGTPVAVAFVRVAEQPQIVFSEYGAQLTFIRPSATGSLTVERRVAAAASTSMRAVQRGGHDALVLPGARSAAIGTLDLEKPGSIVTYAADPLDSAEAVIVPSRLGTPSAPLLLARDHKLILSTCN